VAAQALVQMILRFVQRARGDAEETAKFFREKSTKSLSDVSSGRSGRLAYLNAVFEISTHWKSISKCKHFILQPIRELPYNEIFEAVGNHY